MKTVFDALKVRSSERTNHNLDLEKELMNVFDQQKQRQSRTLKLALAGLVCLIVTASVAEAATGVFSSIIKRVTLDTGNGPQPITEYQTKENADGSTTVTVTLPEGETSGTVTVEATGQ